jgi:hypothetical protein
MIWGYSKLSDFLACPRKYQHKNVLDTKPDGVSDSNLAFGSALHSAINAALTGQDPLEVFAIFWKSYEGKDIAYGRLSWRQLGELGEGFIRKFQKNYAYRFELVVAEKTLRASYKGVLFEGTVDLLAKFDGVLTLVDFKTTSAPYDKARAAVSFQLHLYAYLCLSGISASPEQVMYLPFNKSNGSIQTPVVAPLIESKMYAALDDFVALVPNAGTAYPRNMNSCFNYNKRCEFFQTCHGNKGESNENGE